MLWAATVLIPAEPRILDTKCMISVSQYISKVFKLFFKAQKLTECYLFTYHYSVVVHYPIPPATSDMRNDVQVYLMRVHFDGYINQ